VLAAALTALRALLRAPLTRPRGRLIAAERVENEALGTTDFFDKSGSVSARPRVWRCVCVAALRCLRPAERPPRRHAQLVFRTTPLERHRVVAQLGTASAGAHAPFSVFRSRAFHSPCSLALTPSRRAGAGGGAARG
jgi:hypothetical protein